MRLQVFGNTKENAEGGLAEGPRLAPVERSARVKERARGGLNTACVAWRRIRCSTAFVCMQHMGDDGSREGEREVGGFSGEQVTQRSRLDREAED